MICFDALFPKISRKLAINGGENLLTLANCALFGESNWPLLHRAFFVYRCVENGRPGVYLNNNGNSLAVDSFGRQIVSTPPNKPATVFVKIFPAGHLTFYSQSGDLFAIGCLMLIGPLLIPTIYREVMIKREKLQKNI
jgi:apolipoprotein N-acyltransferase